MRVSPEALVELGHLLVHHRVLLDDRNELALLIGIRQIAVFQQIGDIQEVAVLRQLFDRITTIQEFALVAVNEGDR